MLWFPLALLAVLGLAAYVLLSKYLLRGEKVDPIAYGAGIQLTVATFTLPLAIFSRPTITFNQKTLLLTLLMILLYALASAAYRLGGEVGRIIPILDAQTLPVVIFGALFLGERQNLARKILASLLAVAGIFLMGN